MLKHSEIFGNLLLSRDGFHESYAAFGGPWQREREAAAWNLLAGACDGFQKMLGGKTTERHIKPWRIFGFVSDSIDANGLARKIWHDDQSFYFIVTAGAILDPYLTYIKLAALSDFLPEAPAAGKVLEVPTGVNSAVTISTDRLAFAGRLAVYSGYAIFFHELAHILRGHVLLHCSSQLGRGIAERIEAYAENPDLERRAMETDADYFAGQFMAKMFLAQKGQNQILGSKPNERLFRLAIAIFVAYYTFEELSGYHSGITRIYVALHGLFTSIKGSTKDKARMIDKIMVSLIQFMSTADFTVKDFSLTDFQNLLRDTQPVINEMQAKFVGMRPSEWKEI